MQLFLLVFCLANISKMAQAQIQKATLGGGCFWCMEAVFQRLNGVLEVYSGYMGGETENPSYKEVCTGNTGHAEVVQITFDIQRISFDDLLDIFFEMHDPTTLNRQGNDVGTQYRSVIFYHTPEQQKKALEKIRQLEKSKVHQKKIVTQVLPAQTFYKAEAYHQNYYNLNPEQPYCKLVINPKIEKLNKMFAKYLAK
jgi:peptide-methionine (S)-S-oxide reductase